MEYYTQNDECIVCGRTEPFEVYSEHSNVLCGKQIEYFCWGCGTRLGWEYNKTEACTSSRERSEERELLPSETEPPSGTIIPGRTNFGALTVSVVDTNEGGPSRSGTPTAVSIHGRYVSGSERAHNYVTKLRERAGETS